MYTSVLDDLFEINRQLNRIFDAPSQGFRGNWPETNLYEDKDGYIIVSKVPDIDKSAIEVNLKDNTLTIRGERKKDYPKGSKVLLDERFSGTFERNFILNDKIDAEKIGAEAENGLLVVRLPKSPESKPRKIEIK